MKVFVQPTLMFVGGTCLKHGVNYIDEELEPKLCEKIKMKLEKGDKGLSLYDGDSLGHDPKGSRKKRDDLEADARARKAKNKEESNDDKKTKKK